MSIAHKTLSFVLSLVCSTSLLGCIELEEGELDCKQCDETTYSLQFLNSSSEIGKIEESLSNIKENIYDFSLIFESDQSNWNTELLGDVNISNQQLYDVAVAAAAELDNVMALSTGAGLLDVDAKEFLLVSIASSAAILNIAIDLFKKRNSKFSNYWQLEASLATSFEKLKQYENFLKVPARAIDAFRFGPRYNGAYTSQAGHILSSIHWGASLLQKNQLEKIRVESREVGSDNSSPVDIFKVKSETREEFQPKIDHPYFQELSFSGEGFVDGKVPSGIDEHTSYVYQDYQIGRTREEQTPCLTVAKDYPNAGDIVYSMTHRGILAGRFFLSIPDMEEHYDIVERGPNVDHMLFHYRTMGQDPSLLYAEMEIEKGDSSSPLINKRGELLGVLIQGRSFAPNEESMSKLTGMFVRATHIKKQIEIFFGSERAEELFDCPDNN